MENIKVKLTDSVFRTRSGATRKYLMSLDPDRMLANHYAEAGLNSNSHNCPKPYGGWEFPHQQVRGTILGHYLSACAMYWYYEEDDELHARMLRVVKGLARCQEEAGDGWCFSIPRLYLDRISRGKWVWAPQYNLHKTMMGLAYAWIYGGCDLAFRVLDRASDELLAWSSRFDEEQWQDILDFETGGMMEVFAQVYARTREEKYLTLTRRYAHTRFFDRLLAGGELHNTHANTTIPEAQGMAAAYLATGEEQYRVYAQAYLDAALALPRFCTGGQTSAERWVKELTPSLLGWQDQEHCTVYNMIRLCEYVMRWDGRAEYADYIERNIWGGLLAQQRAADGMNTYFLPLQAGGKKEWSDPEDTMTCCVGTCMQANAGYPSRILFGNEGRVELHQYIPFEADVSLPDGGTVSMKLGVERDPLDFGEKTRTDRASLEIRGDGEAFTLRLRVPSWSEQTRILRDGEEIARFDRGDAKWFDVDVDGGCTVTAEFDRALWLCRLGETDRFAVMYGGETLVGLTGNAALFEGMDADGVLKSLLPRATNHWNGNWRTWECIANGQSVVFLPLVDVDEETYTAYFRIR